MGDMYFWNPFYAQIKLPFKFGVDLPDGFPSGSA